MACVLAWTVEGVTRAASSADRTSSGPTIPGGDYSQVTVVELPL